MDWASLGLQKGCLLMLCVFDAGLAPGTFCIHGQYLHSLC